MEYRYCASGDRFVRGRADEFSHSCPVYFHHCEKNSEGGGEGEVGKIQGGIEKYVVLH